MGLDPGNPGSGPGLKAGTKPLSHPRIPLPPFLKPSFARSAVKYGFEAQEEREFRMEQNVTLTDKHGHQPVPGSPSVVALPPILSGPSAAFLTIYCITW